MSIIKNKTVEEQANSIARYLPGGDLFAAAFLNKTNFRNLLVGFAGQFQAQELALKDFTDYFIPDDANILIPEWEKALGIPDRCFNAQGSLEERQRDILAKLSELGAQTLDDFLNIAEIFNFNIEIYPGRDVWDNPSLAPGITFANIKEARFSLVIVYTADEAAVLPVTLPFTLGTSLLPLLMCLANTIKQANCQVLFDAIIP